MSYEKIIEYVKGLDYPIEKYVNLDECYDNIKNANGVKFTTTFPYTFLTNINSRDIKVNHLGLYILERDTMNKCHNVGSQFNLIVRSKSRRFDSISSYEYWNTKKDEVIKLAKTHLEKYKDDYNNEELPIELGGTESDKNHVSLEHECSLCLFRLGMPSAFPSNLMTAMLRDKISKHNIKYNNDPYKVLDISAGWGDRLISACSMDIFYTACDPNTNMKPIYEKIIDKYGNMNKQRVYTIPFEDYIPEDNALKYNALYTSPPFFDLEIYCEEDTQSTSRYKSPEKWLNCFLKPCLNKCNDLLLEGADIYLHLSDLKSENNTFQYVKDVIIYCTRTLKWKFIGVYGHTIGDKIDKESETIESRNIKNSMLLKPTSFIKSFKDGVRVNKRGEALSQSIWYFIK